MHLYAIVTEKRQANQIEIDCIRAILQNSQVSNIKTHNVSLNAVSTGDVADFIFKENQIIVPLVELGQVGDKGPGEGAAASK